MLRKMAVVLVAVMLAAVARADYGVADRGEWPADWPKELEPLRKEARTLVGPLEENRHYAIRFDKRETLEAAWPLLLKVKSKGAPIVLVRGENFFLGKKAKAGVVVHAPPEGEKGPITLEVVVDGEIVDLNRLEIPKDTPIEDQRFAEKK